VALITAEVRGSVPTNRAGVCGEGASVTVAGATAGTAAGVISELQKQAAPELAMELRCDPRR